MTIAGLVLALAATACTGGSAEPQPDDETDPTAGAREVLEEFTQAWPEPTLANFRGLVDEPGVAAHDIAGHMAELGIAETTVDLADDLDCSGDTCREHAQVTHELSGFGPWSYETLLTATEDQGQWLVEWTPDTFHPDLSEATTLVRHRRLPPRAPILDRNGVALTPEREIVRVGVQPRKVRPPTYDQLAELLGIDANALRDRVQSAQPDWFVPVIDLRRKDYEPLREDLLDVPGITIDTGRRALAPSAEWGRAVLGTVGPATADTLESAGPLTLSTDEVGTSGLQQAFQQQLAGTPGMQIDLVETAPGGDILNQVLTKRPRRGEPLATTLDLQAQNVAERAVSDADTTTSVVVVKASTGEILAAANAPGPTTYNTAFVGRYAPGSTFKTVSAAALLAGGVVQPSTPVECPDTTVVGGKRFKNYERGITGGNPTFADAYAASCNTTFVQYADRLAGAKLAAMGKQFGLGAEWDLGVDAFSGSVPADQDLVTRAADMIGQGKVLASPLAMAMVAATVDSGVARTPTLLPAAQPGQRLGGLDPALVSELQRLMRLTVTDGTAQAIDLPGAPVYAKTGTAEVARKQGGTGTNAWMIGYRGDIAFSVLVEGGSSGAHDAAPIAAVLLENLPPKLYQ